MVMESAVSSRSLTTPLTEGTETIEDHTPGNEFCPRRILKKNETENEKPTELKDGTENAVCQDSLGLLVLSSGSDSMTTSSHT